MSYQYATVYSSPAYNMLSILPFRWGVTPRGYVFIDCYESLLYMNAVRFSWDGTKFTFSGMFDAPCTGVFYEFVFRLPAMGARIIGIGDITDLNIQVEEGESYLVYLVEILTTPTTATVYIT